METADLSYNLFVGGYIRPLVVNQTASFGGFARKWITKMTKSHWNEKGAALSDKSARQEFGLTQDDILAAIKEGKLQYRESHIHGNPYLRLLRKEVEALVTSIHGPNYLANQKLQTELKSVKSQIRSLKMLLVVLLISV